MAVKQLAKHGMLRQDAHKIIAAGTKGIPGTSRGYRPAVDRRYARRGRYSGACGITSGSPESAANAVRHYRNQAKDVYNQVNTVMKYKG